MSIDPATQPTEERDRPEPEQTELYPRTQDLILISTGAIICGGIAFFNYGILEAMAVTNVVGLVLGFLWGIGKLVRPWLVRRSKSRLALTNRTISHWGRRRQERVGRGRLRIALRVAPGRIGLRARTRAAVGGGAIGAISGVNPGIGAPSSGWELRQIPS